MMRFVHALAITGLLGSAAYAYSIKYDTLYFSEEVVKLKAKLRRERDAIAVSKAEWVLMTRPDRLQKIADQTLQLQPIAIGQLARVSDLPDRPTKQDEIGRKLEALGLEPTATPKDKRPGDARQSAGTRTPSR
ncbi:MAG: hypothetical protein JO048_13010 [Methylobacteriaceae bacterium]|nr:hypothetical protein [Methylobacteriaceae bacterium]